MGSVENLAGTSSCDDYDKKGSKHFDATLRKKMGATDGMSSLMNTTTGGEDRGFTYNIKP